jgi:hypothetical protein
MINPKSLENLQRGRKTRFQKGKSGNPGGKPKLPDLDGIMAVLLADVKDGRTAAQGILEVLRMKAVKGDQRAIEYLLDRAYGKPKQTETIEHTGRIITGFEFVDE